MTRTTFTCPEHKDCQVQLTMLSVDEAAGMPGIQGPTWAQDWVNSQLGFTLSQIQHNDTSPQPDALLSDAVADERTYRKEMLRAAQATQAATERRVYRNYWFQLWRVKRP